MAGNEPDGIGGGNRGQSLNVLEGPISKILYLIDLLIQK
jgi:hypothetical protein